MRAQRAASPLLWLLLLPAVVQSLSVPQAVKDAPSTVVREGTNLKNAAEGLVNDLTAKTGATSKAAAGTKDAPVDGLDGKPHAGPWVQMEPESKKKQKAGIEDLARPPPKGLPRLEKEFSSSNGWSLIPEKNDGVMDDANRAVPKKGTLGTEGGVSEKNKLGGQAGRKPDSPKEPPPLPHSEQQRIKASGGDKVIKEKDKSEAQTTVTDKPKGAIGLEKPTDLPSAPKDKTSSNQQSEPEHDAASKDTSFSTLPPLTGGKPLTTSPGTTDEEPEGLIQPLHSYLLALAMILVSEIGDKTFLVAALMAMRHDRIVVFSAAFSALICMTVLSAVLGHAVPTLLPRHFVAFAAGGLFLLFGAKMLREGLAMPADSGVGEEMQEVEAELAEKEELARNSSSNGKAGHHRRRSSDISAFALEAGRGRASAQLPKPARSPSSDRSPSPRASSAATLAGAFAGLNNLLSLILSPAWVQTFVMTFLGEWGDRSQIATIAMAAGQDYWWVTLGAVTGHMFCTGLAVIGGRALAGRVSMRVVTIGGAVAFLVFGVIYMLEATYSEASPLPH